MGLEKKESLMKTFLREGVKVMKLMAFKEFF
jgi:hypothetical protein